jgi:hypothetical protein
MWVADQSICTYG